MGFAQFNNWFSKARNNAHGMFSDDENLQRLLGVLLLGMVLVYERFALDKYGQKKAHLKYLTAVANAPDRGKSASCRIPPRRRFFPLPTILTALTVNPRVYTTKRLTPGGVSLMLVGLS